MLQSGQLFRWAGVGPAAQVVGLLLLLQPTLAGPSLSGLHPDRTVYFELESPGHTGALDPGKPVELSVFLTGGSSGQHPIVAIFEGEPFVRRLVPMTPEPESNRLRASVTLEPFLTGVVEPQERAFRVNVTFAHLRDMQLSRFLTRSVYLTMDVQVTDDPLSTVPFSKTEQDYLPRTMGRGGSIVGEEQGGITEQDLIPSALPARQQAYWHHLSHVISESWDGLLGSSVGRMQAGTVEVRFRLHANGDAQLIQVERSSGIRELDEAGIQAILNTHPFPAFPSELDSDSVDMHVELNRSKGAVARALRSSPSRRTQPSPSGLDRPRRGR